MKKPKNQAKKATSRAGSMRAAAAMLRCRVSWIAEAKASGVQAFAANGTVILEPVRRWIDANRERLESAPESLADQKLREQVRRLKHANDKEAAGLVPLSWIRERFGRVMGEMNAIRSKSESEHPLLFREPAGDVASCRTVTRRIWDDIMTSFQGCGHHFDSPPRV